ncbi:unnamed protein product [Plutella xylostella]|uniref:(diamondback moth) hypothetical protein n=1 Tax=Plutella xylostella TaxID=51655 RepID=A0A8S4FZI1_PLUXY|nr:unnamed protein product [Plutella xylostella]
MRVGERSASGGIGADDSPLRGMLAGAAQFGEGGSQAAPELQWATQPYPARPGPRPAPRPLPRDHAVLLFPGEGSQYLGMGRQLMHIPAVKDLYDLASETVKYVLYPLAS